MNWEDLMVSTTTMPKFKQRQQRTDNKILLLRHPITSFEPTLCENLIKGSGRPCLSNYLWWIWFHFFSASQSWKSWFLCKVAFVKCVQQACYSRLSLVSLQNTSQVFVPSVDYRWLISHSLLLPPKNGWI